MKKNFKYLRVSVTDRCNFRCIYCMPEPGVKKCSHDEILRYEEILRITEATLQCGVEQVRITGGEPLVRSGLSDFVKQLAAFPEIKDIALTTNGALLPKMAQDLKKSGLSRVNISLDSLDSDCFSKITRLGNLSQVLEGIDAALEAGLKPVKINVVLLPGINDQEINSFVEFAAKKDVWVRFIEKMPFEGGENCTGEKETFVSENEVLNEISKFYELIPLDKNTHGPSSEFKIKNGLGGIGFISSRTHPFCSDCSRLRLTANGFLLPCLDADYGIKVKDMPKSDIIEVINKLAEEKGAWKKCQATYQETFNSSLSKIGG